ncbi:MAG: AMP-binding protein [Gammaproteobacteria bacterium]|nr:AMP-binding protein [Gammaproteobacteria bacterium]
MKLTEQAIETQLITIIQQLLAESGTQYSQRKITLTISLQKHLGIDSLGRAELFQRIEKHFNVHLPDNLLAEADSLEDIAKAIYTATPVQMKVPREFNTEALKKSRIDMSSATTLNEVVERYALEAPERPHIYMLDENGREEMISYGKLYESALQVAHGIQKYGLKPGDTVAIMQPTNPRFFYTFFGILLAGCVPVPIYPPLRPHQIEAYAKQEAKILQNAQVRMLVTFHEAENISQLLRAFIPSLKAVVTTDTLMKSKEKAKPYIAKPEDFGLIQYTSGSTSAPKGVLLTHQNLISNIHAFGQSINITPDDATVSWLPLYHDLGLIGLWLGSLYHGLPLNALSPLTFLNRPEQWLWAIHHHRATISGGPNFAYELCVRKIDPATIEGLDLSSWRIAANGAEAIQPKTLQRFAEKFAPYGFKLETFLPVYGLAESTVGLAVSPPGRKPWIDKVDRKAYEETFLATPTEDVNCLEFVSCGPPLPGHEVRIVDDENQLLPARHIGHLQFKGPSNMQGYYGNPEATFAIYHDGWLDSGDYAYLVDGEVFITGRCKDTIIKAGRNLYPTEIEDIAATVPGIRKGCVIAFGAIDPKRGTEKLIVVAESAEKRTKERNEIIQQIIDKINTALDIAPDDVILVPPRLIPKTSSGKLQRSACRAAYLEGKLAKAGMPVWMQITKLGVGWVGFKTRNTISKLGKFLYTTYLAILLVLTLPFIWLGVSCLPRKIAAPLCKGWARLLFVFAFCPIKVTGKENLTQSHPVIYTPNHASYIDSLLLMALLPSNTRFVGKQELLKTPIIRTFVNKLGYLTVDRIEQAKGVADAKNIDTVLEQGNPVVIFPEGTFTYATGLRPFKSGAFKAAIDTKTPLMPVAIQGTRQIMRGEERLLKPGIIRVNFSPLIKPEGQDWQELTRLKTATREEIAKHCGESTLDMILAGPSGNPDEAYKKGNDDL